MASMNSPTIPDALIRADLSFQILNDHATQHRKGTWGTRALGWPILGHACPRGTMACSDNYSYLVDIFSRGIKL